MSSEARPNGIPGLVAEAFHHLRQLIRGEFALAQAEVAAKARKAGFALAVLAFAAVLTGVAILLWCSLPAAGDRAPWLFVLTPALPAHAGLWILWLAHRRDPTPLLTRLKLQLAQDAEVLRAWSRP